MDGVVHAYISNDVFYVARTMTRPASTPDSIPDETGPGATEIEMTVTSGAYTFGNEGECPLPSSSTGMPRRPSGTRTLTRRHEITAQRGQQRLKVCAW